MRFTMCLCVSLKDGREQPCGKGNKLSPTTGSRNALCQNALVMPNASKHVVYTIFRYHSGAVRAAGMLDDTATLFTRALGKFCSQVLATIGLEKHPTGGFNV